MADITGQFFILNGREYPVSGFEKFEHLPERHPSISEVIRVEEGIPLFVGDYLDRLEHSFTVIGRNLFMDRPELLAAVHRLITLNKHTSGPVKITLGTSDFSFYLFYIMKPHLPAPEEYITGVRTILLQATRHNPNAKVWNSALRSESIAAMQASGAYEAVLVDESGYITEASRSNVFFIQNNHLVTSPASKVLPGITRKKVLEICASSHINVKMEQVKATDLGHYEACFLTGTARKIVPVRSIDAISFSVDHPLMQIISRGYEKLVNEYLSSSTPGSSAVALGL
jgi:branched-chain amino acid aminotransferase